MWCSVVERVITYDWMSGQDCEAANLLKNTAKVRRMSWMESIVVVI